MKYEKKTMRTTASVCNKGYTGVYLKGRYERKPESNGRRLDTNNRET